VVHATSWEEAHSTLSLLEFDVILLGLDLPDARGIEAIQRLRSLASDSAIVVLEGSRNSDVTVLALRALRASAQECLCRDEVTPDRLRRAVRQAMERRSCEVERLRLEGLALAGGCREGTCACEALAAEVVERATHEN
jgi:DNA-binding NarL/FixJ family response regulator